jgi:hypothetical protein
MEYKSCEKLATNPIPPQTSLINKGGSDHDISPLILKGNTRGIIHVFLGISHWLGVEGERKNISSSHWLIIYDNLQNVLT